MAPRRRSKRRADTSCWFISSRPGASPVATTPVDFPILLDRDRAVAKAWNVATLPTTFVLDGGLRPRFVVETDYAWDSLDPKELTSTSAVDAGGPLSIKDARNR
jgi:hypothetical protein